MFSLDSFEPASRPLPIPTASQIAVTDSGRVHFGGERFSSALFGVQAASERKTAARGTVNLRDTRPRRLSVACLDRDGAVMQSFTFAKKKAPQAKVAVQHEEKKEEVEFVTGVAENGLEGTKGTTVPEVKVIPKIQNTFEVGTGRQRKVSLRRQFSVETRVTDKRYFYVQAPSFIPTKEEIEQDAQRFHVAETIAASGGEVAQHGVSYGLTKMGPKGSTPAKGRSDEERAKESFIGKSLQEKELQAFKEDMEDLPDQASMDDYEDMPIEDFGKAMLRGMGWEEGKAVGRMHKGMVEAVEFIPRPGRLGLGAQPATKDEPQKKYIKPGESREKKADMVRDPQVVASAGLRNVKTLDENLVQREAIGPRKGKMMFIASGRHAGISARVIQITGEKVSVELTNSGKIVTVRTIELEETGASKRATVGEKRDRDGKGKTTGTSAKPWLFANIRVRVVSKSFQQGQFYLMKGIIEDVLTPTECMLRLEDGGKTIEIGQRALETVVPRPGGRVCVVAGKFCGRRGKLLEKYKSNDTASIQLNDDFEAHILPLDCIAEYAGAMDAEDD